MCKIAGYTRCRYARHNTHDDNLEEPVNPGAESEPAPRLLRYVFVVALSLAVAVQAQSAPVREQSAPPQGALKNFLSAVRTGPELLASRAAVEAAELQLRAAYDPVALETTGGYSRFDLDESNPLVQLPDRIGLVPGSRTQLSATLTFRPLPFGDTADLVKQSELDLELRILDYRAALTRLEGRALEAALSARLAARSALLSREGVVGAEASLRATRTRFERGVANARELRRAEANLIKAQALLQNAEADVRLARLNLTSLVGDAPPPSFAVLTSLRQPGAGTPLSVRRAQIPILRAELGVRGVQRTVYPVVQASYTRNLSDRSSLVASIESRTLQPSVNFSYGDPGRLFGNVTEGSLQVGVAANISLGTLDTLGAAERQVEAARGSLEAARQGTTLRLGALGRAHEAARRNVELRRLEFGDAETTLRENRKRETLGLTPPPGDAECAARVAPSFPKPPPRRSGGAPRPTRLQRVLRPPPFGDPAVRLVLTCVLPTLLLFGVASAAHALSFEEALEHARLRPSVVSAQLEVQDARASLQRVRADPLGVRADTVPARQRAELAEATLEGTRYAALREIAAAYTGVLEARAQVQLAREGVRLNETLLRVAEISLETGSVTGLEVGEADDALQRATNSLRAAAEGRDLAATRLTSLVGPIGSLGAVPTLYQPPLPPLEAALKAAQRHPTLLQREAQLELAQFNLDALEPLYAARAQIAAARSQLERARAGAREAQRGSSLRVRALYTRAENAQANLQLEDAALESARARSEQQRQLFREGLVAQVEVMQAEFELERAALERLATCHTYLKTLLELQAGSLVALEGPLGQAGRAGTGATGKTALVERRRHD